MKRYIKGPYIDWGEDLNLYVPDDKHGRDPLASALFTDDAIKTAEIALSETIKRMTPYWINSAPLVTGYVTDQGDAHFFYLDEDLKKKIVLLDFIDLGSPLSLRYIPYCKEWLKRYHGADVEIIGVINSRYSYIKQTEHIAIECKKLGLTFPIVIDHDFAIWRAFETRFRPRKILLNHEQKIVADFIGSCCHKEIEDEIQNALRIISPGLPQPRSLDLLNPKDDEQAYSFGLSPEVTFGLQKPTPLGNKESLSENTAENIIFQKIEIAKMVPNKPYLHGPWSPSENSIYVSSHAYNKNLFSGDASVAIKFMGGSVYALIGAKNYLTTDAASQSRLQVLLNGKPIKDVYKGADIKVEEGKKSFIYVHEPRLFEIAKNLPTTDTNTIDILFPSMYVDNIDMFSFSFGT